MGQVKKSPQSPAPAPPPQRQYLTPSGIVALGPVEPENEPDERYAESTSIGEPTDTDISCFDFSRRNSNTDDAYRLKIELSDEDGHLLFQQAYAENPKLRNYANYYAE